MQAWVGTDLADVQSKTVRISTSTIVGYAHFFRVAGWHQGQPARAAQAERVSTCLNPSLERVTKRRYGSRWHSAAARVRRGREPVVGSSARYRGSKTGVLGRRQPLRMGPHVSPAHVPYDSPRSLNQVRTRQYDNGCATSATICGRAGRKSRRRLQ
jgi:hypothetical protein